MSDEPRRSYTGREIVLELFPATPDRLIPRSSAYLVQGEDDGATIRDRASGRPLLQLASVERANRRTVQLCCDLCTWSGESAHLRFLRAVVPGSAGRRWRYLIACVDLDACDARRLDDDLLDRLLRGD